MVVSGVQICRGLLELQDLVLISRQGKTFNHGLIAQQDVILEPEKLRVGGSQGSTVQCESMV